MNIVDVIRAETSLLRGKTAMIEGDRAVTYGELLDKIGGLHEILAAKGIAAGQRIALRCADGIDYVIGSLGLLECGAAVVPVADSLTESEVRETIERIDVAGVLTHVSLPGLCGDEGGQPIGDLFRWRSRASGSEMDDRCRALGAAFIRFSSGTTGKARAFSSRMARSWNARMPPTAGWPFPSGM